MLTAVKLVDQWSALERRLPPDWESIALRVRAEQREDLAEASRVLGPMGVARSGDELLVTVHRAGGPAGRVLLVRPGHGVVLGIGFERARPDPRPVAMHRPEAADVDRPEIEGRLAAGDPFGERAARAAGGGDAEGVEARADIEALQLRRLP